MGNYLLNKILFCLVTVFFIASKGNTMPFYYEENAKRVNDIFLSTIAKGIDIFTTQQADDLYDIANQCPLAGGEAVYCARAMYSLIDADAYYLDKDLCTQSGNNWRKGETLTTNESFQLYPNPTESTVNVHYNVIENITCIFTLYNTLGQVQQQTYLLNNVENHTINVSKLASGVYYYKLVENGMDKYSGKLIVIK